MIESTYKRLVGPVNPKKPNESLGVHLKMLWFVGLWAPDTTNELTKALYTCYSFLYRGIFLYMYSFCQAMFFMNVAELKDVADALFLLMTQISLIYKVEKFYSNRHRIRAIVRRLNSDLFCPTCEEEDQAIKIAMLNSVLCCLGFLVPAALTISSWAIAPFLSKGDLQLPLAAWYPFDTKPVLIYIFMFVFQIYGIAQSATFNISTDTIAAALLVHAKAQLERLGIMLAKLGYDSGSTYGRVSLEKQLDHKSYHKEGMIIKEYLDKNYKKIVEVSDVDEEMREINEALKVMKRKYGENYGELIRCIIFHERILEFVAELQDIFRKPIFCQFMFSSLIICMTLLLIVNQTSNADVVGSLSYLITMVAQILIFCWTGNEIIYSSYRLSERVYFANFTTFDRFTARAMIIFMRRAVRDIHVKAGGVFQVTLSVATFMAIIKSSYSYFAVLQTMQNK